MARQKTTITVKQALPCEHKARSHPLLFIPFAELEIQSQRTTSGRGGRGNPPPRKLATMGLRQGLNRLDGGKAQCWLYLVAGQAIHASFSHQAVPAEQFFLVELLVELAVSAALMCGFCRLSRRHLCWGLFRYCWASLFED
eukprot:363291-Chlamydomonas_euryale.AAC.15